MADDTIVTLVSSDGEEVAEVYLSRDEMEFIEDYAEDKRVTFDEAFNYFVAKGLEALEKEL